MADIVLLTFNARYHHSSFGLRYLQANLGDLAVSSAILEYDLEKRPAEALEDVLRLSPRIIGLAVYIWNTRQSLEFANLLKAVRPDLRLIIGGPEVSFEIDSQPLCAVADHVIAGEADLAFAELSRDILAGHTPPHIINAPPPDLAAVAMPYHLYTADDLAHRTIYVESSRGCPFSCEFCLSSLDIPVRRFPLEPFLAEMQKLIDRGARQFKFVDRTFNIDIRHATAILQFFLARDVFVHFEMIPDHLPAPLRDLLAQFRPGQLQLEIGVQSFDEDVCARIGRRQDNQKAEENLRFLREHTQAHLHVDLIAGLPGESLQQFAAGFDRLLALSPHEIQLGILKRLRGAPIERHTRDFGMVYAPDAPYEIACNNLIDFPTMQRIKRVARYWDLFANSGNFRGTLPLLLTTPFVVTPQGGSSSLHGHSGPSAFERFLAFSDFIYARTGRTHQISLQRQTELLLEHIGHPAGPALARDYLRPGRRDLPNCLLPYASHISPRSAPAEAPRRQERHMA